MKNRFMFFGRVITGGIFVYVIITQPREMIPVFLAFAALTGLLLVYYRIRSNSIEAAGRVLGFQPLSDEDFSRYPILTHDPPRTVRCAIRGKWKGRNVVVADMFQSAGRGGFMQTVLVMELPGRPLPKFAAIERWHAGFTSYVDLPRVPTPDNLKQFWFVCANDGLWPFGEKTQEWLNKFANRKGLLSGWFHYGWSCEGVDNCLYLYRLTKTVSPNKMTEWLDEAIQVACELGECIYSDVPAPVLTLDDSGIGFGIR